MLQTHILRHRESPLHGDHTQPCMCQQVCLLLEVSISNYLSELTVTWHLKQPLYCMCCIAIEVVAEALQVTQRDWIICSKKSISDLIASILVEGMSCVPWIISWHFFKCIFTCSHCFMYIARACESDNFYRMNQAHKDYICKFRFFIREGSYYSILLTLGTHAQRGLL